MTLVLPSLLFPAILKYYYVWTSVGVRTDAAVDLVAIAAIRLTRRLELSAKLQVEHKTRPQKIQKPRSDSQSQKIQKLGTNRTSSSSH